MVHKSVVHHGYLLVCLLCLSSNAQHMLFPTPLSPRIANYDIDVRLNSEKHTLVGAETLTWHNTSSDYINELQFHLYLNAFRNNRSSFVLDSNRRWSDKKYKQKNWGYIDVTSITTAEGEDLAPHMHFIQPDDDNPEDKTVLRVPLPEPIAPGGSIVLHINFKAKLPEPPISRNGAKAEYAMVAQWFPKIGVYEHGKWNCHQYHYRGEFYADYGVYNVRITVPEKNIVGATGIEVSRQNNSDGTVTHFYHAEDVHDFAWSTSPDFVEFIDQSQDVQIRVLMQKDHVNQSERYMTAAKLAVAYFQDTYGDYPFANLTVIDPRRGADQSGGMEYPTLITAATAYGIPEKLRLPEMVILHEFGHNYWYHLTANNEYEEAWLDEGINTYSEIQIFNDLYGPTGNIIDLLGLKISDLQFNRMGYISLPDRDPIVRNAQDFYSGGSYGVLSYYKSGLALTTLQNYLGRETMLKIMRTFLGQWRFKHPHTQDFIDVANQVSGRNLDWFFDQVLYSAAVLDYSVTQISSRSIDKKTGFDYAYSTVSDSALSDTTIASVGDSTQKSLDDSAKTYKSSVRVERLGSFIFPVELQVVFTNGDTVRECWDGRDEWVKFTYVRKAEIEFATVDPDNKIPMDVNLVNNSRTRKTQSTGINKWMSRGLFAVQFSLDLPELFIAIIARIIG
ncbi:M1 family metallopeptidase [candidate division KSB1 bacterium]|nr:M1 family metallopeptidase [candidate division KSB1 bacterium]